MRTSIGPSRARATILVAVIALVASSCYFPQAWRIDRSSGSTEVAWWCQGTTDLGPADCLELSGYLDLALDSAAPYRVLADALAAGATEVVDRPAGIGVAYARPGCCTTFDPATPNILLYDGTDPGSRLVGLAWGVDGAEPAGFVGDLDEWTEVGSRWWLTAWVVEGYENHPAVFAPSHPCLEPGAALVDTSSACYVASHPLDFEILVTNDDGIGAPGIDAIVEALRVLPGVNVTVVAPAVNQSGTGDTTSPGPLTASASTTASGYAGIAVNGTPGDSVLYALGQLQLAPDLIVSGINSGQNMGPIIPASGTVGAAKWGERGWVPAIATSQGLSATPDYPAGVAATLALVEEFRLGTRGTEIGSVTNVNIPTCATGAVRGTLDTVVATDLAGRNYLAQNCESTVTTINDDIDAFNHGFVGITEVPS